MKLHRRVRTSTSRFVTALHVLSDKLAQRRPLWMVTLAIDETNLSEGLRAASAASAVLFLGLLLDTPILPGPPSAPSGLAWPMRPARGACVLSRCWGSACYRPWWADWPRWRPAMAC